jgi:hypothetical protein
MMLDATQNFSKPLDKERLIAWHAALFPTGRSGMLKIAMSNWRDDSRGSMQVVSGPMGKEVSRHSMKPNKKVLSPQQREELLRALKDRFEKNMNRHKGLEWPKVQAKLEANPEKLWSLHEMERTGGEPDVIGHDKKTGEYIFYDCSAESPKGRRSVCYDREALDARKESKPASSAMEMAAAMGIELLTEEQYRELQKLGNFDTKTSSWVKTPPDIRKLGGALFCDRRYDTVFVYHNGAESYYAARGFRGSLRV